MSRPAGILVTVLGPDGSGKGSLIAAAEKQIRQTMQCDTAVYHWRPWCLPSLRSLLTGRAEVLTDATPPHPRKPSKALLSVLRLAYYTADYVIGYWLSVRADWKRGRAVVFFERYFYDFYFDPARLMASPPGWAVRFFNIFVPRPDLIVFLTTDPEKVRERKPELPIEEICRQIRAMHALADRLGNVVWLDTSKSLDCAANEAVTLVRQTLRKRQEST